MCGVCDVCVCACTHICKHVCVYLCVCVCVHACVIFCVVRSPVFDTSILSLSCTFCQQVMLHTGTVGVTSCVSQRVHPHINLCLPVVHIYTLYRFILTSTQLFVSFFVCVCVCVCFPLDNQVYIFLDWLINNIFKCDVGSCLGFCQ